MQTKNETQSTVQQTVKLKEPSMFSVVMHNDDVTTMDFVVMILMRIFKKSAEEASNIMMQVHNNGSGIAGVYIYDIAITKKLVSEQLAREKGFPLRLSIEPEDNIDC